MLSEEKKSLNEPEVFYVDYEYDDTKKMVYAPLNSFLGLIEYQEYMQILNFPSSEKSKGLISYINSKPKIDIAELKRNFEDATPELSMALTDNCNLRCLYCHASAGEAHKRKSMTPEMVESILIKYFAFIVNSPLDVLRISFNGGGEPTFNFSLLKFAVEKAREIASSYGKKCLFSMATNGCYGDEIRRYIVDNFSQISLSFDGPDYIQNMQRPLANGAPSFNMVFDTANYFYKNNFPFALRATISEYSLKYLKEIVDFIIANFPNISFGMEALNPFGRGQFCKVDGICPPDKQEFSDKFIELLKYTEDKPISLLNAASSEYDIIRLSFCSNVGIPNWTVNVNGTITACSRDNMPDVFTFGKFDEKTNEVCLFEQYISELKKFSVPFYPECQECFCKYHCAGDCPDRRISDKSDCEAIRKIGRYVLSQKLKSL